jgi:hypothetical protein
MGSKDDTHRSHGRLALLSGGTRYALGIESAGAESYRMAGVHFEKGRAVEMTFAANVDAGTVRGELSRLGYRRGAYAVLAVPRHVAVWETARVPTRDAAQLSRVVLNEAKVLSHWPEDATALGYEVRDDPEEGYSRVDYIFVHRDVIREHVERLRSWGVVLSRVELSTFGLARLLSAEETPARMIRIAGTQCEIVQCEPGGAVAASIGADREPEEAVNAALDWMKNAASGDASETPLFIAADDSAGLANRFSFRNAHGLSELQRGVLNGIGPLEPPVEVAVGAALARMSAQPTSSLLPPEETRAHSMRQALRLGALLTVLLLAFAAMSWALARHYAGQEQAYADAVRQELRTLRSQAGDLESKWEQLGMMQGELAAVPLPLRVVLALYEHTPTSIAINHMRFDPDRGVVLSGEAPAHAAVLEYVDALRKAPEFAKVDLESSSQPTLGADTLVDFKITCTLRLDSVR